MSKLGLKIIEIVCLVAFVIAVIFSAGYFYIFNQEEIELKEELRDCVIEAAKVIDAEKLDKIIGNNLAEGPEHTDILNSMLMFKATQNVKNLYIFTKKDQQTALFVIDASADPAGFMEEYEMDQDMLNTFDGNATVAREMASDKWGTFLSAFAPIKGNGGQVIAIVGADSDVASFQRIKNQFLMAMIAAIIIALLITVFISFMFSRRIRKNINILKYNLDAMGNGDLTGKIDVPSKDEFREIGALLDDFRINISNTLDKIRQSVIDTNTESKNLSVISNEMSVSAKNVSSVIDGIAGASNDQASNITGINRTLNEFGQDLEDIVKLIENIDTSANHITLKSKSSSDDINLVIDFINKINMELKQVTEKIQGLGESINKIDEITNLINTIADQTNLLALNASIEAARAGEAGKGFSVVADEIGKLAEQSKISSQNINTLLKNLSAESDNVINNTESVNSKMLSQTGTISAVAVSLKDIITGIDEIIPQIHSVNESLAAANNRKQLIINSLESSSASVEEISASSEEIAASSEILSESTEQVASAAGKLTDMMNFVETSVNRFKV